MLSFDLYKAGSNDLKVSNFLGWLDTELLLLNEIYYYRVPQRDNASAKSAYCFFFLTLINYQWKQQGTRF